MADNNVFVPIELPPEIMAQMPPDLTLMEKHEWRKKKAAELRAQQEQEAAAQTQTENVSESVFDESPPQAEYSTATVNEASTVDTSADQSEKTDIPSDAVHKKSISKKSKQTKKQAKRAVKSSPDDLDVCNVRDIPKNIIHTLKRIFPQAGKNAELLSAAAYIFTNGECEISPEAMKLVRSYESDNGMIDVLDRLALISQVLRSLDERTSAIELCVCFDAFDRRFGSRERRRSPRENEFMEPGCLDFLYRLRVQSEDLRHMDDLERGRSIYEPSEDENKNKN